MDHIDTILTTVVKTLFDGGTLSVGHVMSADVIGQLGNAKVVTASQVVLTEVAFVLSVIFAGVIVYIAIQRRALASSSLGAVSVMVPESEAVVSVPGALNGRWGMIVSHLDSTRENDWKQAVVEADKLVDSALQQAGYPGDTFGDRLTNIQPGTLVSLDGLWWAHRIRNRIAHEMDYFLRYTEARQAVSYYEAVLAELQLL